MWTIWIILGLALMAAVSAGLSLGAHLVLPRWNHRRRTLTASAIATMLPMSLAYGGFFIEAVPDMAEDGGDVLLGLLALIVLQMVLWAVICLPPAWFTSSRLERDETHPSLAPSDEPEMIGADN